MNNANRLKALAALVVAALVPLSAGAVIDVTAVTTTIADTVTAAGTVGVAALAMHFGIKAYKWIRSAA